MSKQLPKHYDHSSHEGLIYKKWEKADVFAAVPDERSDIYVIMMPLPNVTGALHMGHAMDNMMQDLLIRWHRMMGDNTLWMPGTDHAGIATQAVVEKRLFELEGKTRHDIGREGLVAKIWAWKDEYQQRIVRQLQSMGCSCDWGRQRFTMDAVCTRSVREAFFRLFQDKLIYRGDRLVNWDVQLQTAISDDEIVYEKVQGHFWHIRYPVVEPQPGEPEYITVATTRPETMLGDTAVACHPDPASELDKLIQSLWEKTKNAPRREVPHLEDQLKEAESRKHNLLPFLLKLKEMAQQGRKILLPLLNREIPLILDPWAKPEIGSGCVKITPAHDPNDYDVWSRHRTEIDIINILNPEGTLNHKAGPYAGLDRFEARAKVVEDLETAALLEKVEDREIEIGHSDRSKTPIEPYLSKQWFIRMGDIEGGILCGKDTKKEFKSAGLAQVAVDAVDRNFQSPSGRNLTFHPDHERYSSTYLNWLSEKRDWCISRQLWWGHRIPIWMRSCSPEELHSIIKGVFPEGADNNVCIRLADQEGNIFDLNESQKIQQLSSLNLLVCLRNKEAENKYGQRLEAQGLKHDPDVLDTWFSSALWPFSTLGWPDPETAEVDPGQRLLGKTGNLPDCLSYYYPGSCLVTGRDIITLWVARMQVIGLYFLGDVPFTDCFIHANIQDGKGERMSKSKGNGIDPEEIIERYGADTMRYVLCDMQTGTQDIRLPVQAISPYTGELVDLATAKHGRTIFTYICPQTGKEFDVLGTMPDLPLAKIISKRFDSGRAFCTKLWNAARFSLMNLGEHRFSPVDFDSLLTEDRWILSRLSRAIGKVTVQLEAYNPSAAIGAARDFFWSELCDWYLEIIKPRLKNNSADQTARTVLALAMDRVLRLFHPFVPFITEALWEHLNSLCPIRGLEQEEKISPFLISAAWPETIKKWEDKSLEEEFQLAQDVVRAVRDLRSRYQISPHKELTALIKAKPTKSEVLVRLSPVICHLGHLSSLKTSHDIERSPTAAIQVLGDMELYLPSLIDPAKEAERLRKQLEKLIKDLARAEANLSNGQFLERAPSHVVKAEKKNHQDLLEQIKVIKNNLTTLETKNI